MKNTAMKNTAMKKRSIYLGAAMMLACVSSYGQAWNVTGGTVNTYTNDNVGIGSVAIPTDANLHIHNFWGSNAGFGCGGFPVAYMEIPALKIDDNRLGSMSIPFGVSINHNIFEIWHSDYLCSFGATPSTRLSFFVNDGLDGTFVGINKPTASSTLDVGGNFNADGNATIGTNAVVASDRLTVNGIMGMYDPSDAPYARGVHGNSIKGGLCLYAQSAYTNGAGIEIWGEHSTYNGSIHFLAYPGQEGRGVAFDFINGKTGKNIILGNLDGSVQIAGPTHDASGLPMSGKYGLYVGDGILTEMVKVAVVGTADWSDFVFNKNYKLMPLSKVASYIDNNKHLPGVPSAEEVVKDGIDLGKMDATLLQKIEELTLYVIDQQKQIDGLNKKIEQFNK